MRLGFFGGTFDPPHLGHVAVAQAAVDQFALNSILWVPAGRQPLKGDGRAAHFEDRVAMVEATCELSPRFHLSLLDAPKENGSANFTVDTLRHLRAEMPGAEVYAIAGADSFAALGQWKEPAALLELAEWIVVSRPGFQLTQPAGLTLTPDEQARIHLLDCVHEDVSATALRARLARGERCDNVLAPGVMAYIDRHGMYGDTRTGVEVGRGFPAETS